jgi:hypothetical protein
MDASHAADEMPDGAVGAPQPGPTVLRMLVGTQLRRLREARQITCEHAGATIRASHSKISRLECGRSGFKQRDVADLLTLYGVRNDAERATLLALAERANALAWWNEYSGVVPDWFETYLGLEPAASVIRTYEVQFVPGLLQTEDYARAVVRLAHHDAPHAETEQRVSLRVCRQRLLRRMNPPKLWAVIDEAALRRPIGSRATMRVQIKHLIEMAELPNVTIEILPFSTGGHAAAGGPITILRFPEDEIADVVYLEQLTSAVYANKTSDVDTYWHIMNRLVIEAEPPTASIAILQGILRET